MYWMDAAGLYTAEPPTRKLRKVPEINALMLRLTIVISRSGVRIRPPAPAQLNMGEFQSGQMGQTVNLLAMPSVVRIHLPPPNKRGIHADVSFIGVKTVVDSNRGRLETCRGKSAMPLLEADKGMALFPQPQLLQGYANADLQKLNAARWFCFNPRRPARRQANPPYLLPAYTLDSRARRSLENSVDPNDDPNADRSGKHRTVFARCFLRLRGFFLSDSCLC